MLLELNPISKFILRQFQNLSWPNFFIPSTKLIQNNFKTCLCQILCSTERTYSLSSSRQMILLGLSTRDHLIINTERTAITFIRLPPSTTLFPRGETLFRFLLIMLLELNPISKFILRQFQNLSWPNFFIPSTKLIQNYFKTCLCQILCSTERTYSLSISRQMILMALAQHVTIRL